MPVQGRLFRCMQYLAARLLNTLNRFIIQTMNDINFDYISNYYYLSLQKNNLFFRLDYFVLLKYKLYDKSL